MRRPARFPPASPINFHLHQEHLVPQSASRRCRNHYAYNSKNTLASSVAVETILVLVTEIQATMSFSTHTRTASTLKTLMITLAASLIPRFADTPQHQTVAPFHARPALVQIIMTSCVTPPVLSLLYSKHASLWVRCLVTCHSWPDRYRILFMEPS